MLSSTGNSECEDDAPEKDSNGTKEVIIPDRLSKKSVLSLFSSKKSNTECKNV